MHSIVGLIMLTDDGASFIRTNSAAVLHCRKFRSCIDRGVVTQLFHLYLAAEYYVREIARPYEKLLCNFLFVLTESPVRTKESSARG